MGLLGREWDAPRDPPALTNLSPRVPIAKPSQASLDFQLSPWYSRLMNQEKPMTHFRGRHFETWHVAMVTYDDSYALCDVTHRYDGRYNVEVTHKDQCGSHIGETQTVATFPTSESAIEFISQLVKL